MNIVRIEPVSTIDWPNEVASVFFVAGCNFKCSYCFNKDLIKFGKGKYTLEEALKLVPAHIDSIVLSGGEPFAQEGIVETIHELKKKGYKVAVHTNGSFPELLDKVIYELDYIAMDVKGLLSKYKYRTGCNAKEQSKVFNSIVLITNKGFPHEFRTTVIPEMKWTELYKIANLLDRLHAYAYYLQTYTPVNGEGKEEYMSTKELERIAKKLALDTKVR